MTDDVNLYDWQNPRKTPIPDGEVIQIKSVTGGDYFHCISEHGKVIYGSGEYEKTFRLKDIAYWRLKPPANFRYPGDAPGTWPPRPMEMNDEQR